MLLFKKLLSSAHAPYLFDDEEDKKKYHLIQAVSIELLLLNLLLFTLNIYFEDLLNIGILSACTLLILLNLQLVAKNYGVALCGHLINLLCFSMITLGNAWLGGGSSSSLSWFYISPIIAAVTIGVEGLILYGILSTVMLIAFIFGNIAPFHELSPTSTKLLNEINYLFIISLVCTTLYSFLKENTQYEHLLKEQNFLLHADKQKFHYLSHHDSLTNLPNRSYFHSYLQETLETLNEHQNTMTLYFMDLDGFKKINDQYGHEVGDLLLLQAGKRLQSCFRTDDFIARLGGDEFTAIIKHKANDRIAQSLAERVKNEFKKPFIINQIKLVCPMSIGKANYPIDADNTEKLLKAADTSMYKSKKRKQLLSQPS